MLYKPFPNIPLDIGALDDAIVQNWEALSLTYNPWHVDRKPIDPISLPEDTMVTDNLQYPQPMQLDEWELLSQLHPTNDMQLSDLDNLGRCDFDKNHNWHDTTIPLDLQELSIDFIQNNRSEHPLPQPAFSNTPNSMTLSPTQMKAHSIIMNHSAGIQTSLPL